MPPISPTFDSNNGYGSQLDVNKAINAKFKEPVQKEYDNLGLTLTDNETEYVSSAYAITYNSTAVSIEIDDIEYSLGIPTDLDDLVLKLNDVLDIGIFYLDAYDDIIARGFHDFGDILQDGHAVFEPDIITPLTNKATQSDINRELALRLEAAGGGGGTVTSITYSLSGTSLQSIFDVNGAETATITTSGTFTMTLNTQTANYVFAGPTTGAAAIPTFRALVAADIPTLSSLYWALDGNTVGSIKWIGTVDNYALPFRTNSIERGRFDTSGNFMVGVTTANSQLEVYGTTFPSSLPFITNNGIGVTLNNGTGRSVVTSHYTTAGGSNSSVLDFIPDIGLHPLVGMRFVRYNVKGADDAFFELFSGATGWSIFEGLGGLGSFITTNGSIPIAFGTNRTEQMRFTTNGDLGINTTSPLARLNVVGAGTTSSTINFISSNSDGSRYFSIYDDGEMYVGNGKTNATPATITIHATSGSGTDIAGANLQYAIGQATGNATSGDHLWYYAPSGSTGTTLTTLTEAMRLKGTTGQLIIGNSSKAVTSSMLQLTNVGASPSFFVSSATPESAITGTRGDICLVNTGAAGQLYVKATGSATNTGWLQLTTGAAGSYITTDGTTTGATSQAQVFTIGVKTPFIDDNAAGTIEMTISSVVKASFSTQGLNVAVSGSAAVPSLSVSGNVHGFYEKSATELGVSIGAALVGGFDATGVFAGLAGTLSGTVKVSGSSSGTITIQTAAAAGTWTLTLPTTDGNSGEYLQTNGSGVTTWAVPAGTGANTALSNLASVAINTTLLPSSNDGAALGSGTLSFSDLFLASGGLINFANSDWIATHSTGILTVGTGDLRITTAGTNSASVVTVGGTQTLTNKSIVATQLTGTAYTFAANNTNATAAYTLHHYENHDLADYGGSFTWNSTPPSTIVTQKYAWSRIGNTVTLFISVLYTSAGTTNTTCAISMPSDCPNPAVFANSGDAASEYMYPINGARVEQTQTANPSAIRGGIRRNSGDTAFEISLIFGSTSALQLQVTVTYRTA